MFLLGMYVFMGACMCVCMHEYRPECCSFSNMARMMYVRMHGCMCVCMDVCAYARMYLREGQYDVCVHVTSCTFYVHDTVRAIHVPNVCTCTNVLIRSCMY